MKDCCQIPEKQLQAYMICPVCHQSGNANCDVVYFSNVQIKANRCGCEVNNPQGSCCLGNVMTFVHGLNQLQV